MHCEHCQYDLTGLPEQHVCPECGQTFDKAVLRAVEVHFASLGYESRPAPPLMRRLARHAQPVCLTLSVAFPAVTTGLILLAGAGSSGWGSELAGVAAFLGVPATFSFLMLAGVLARQAGEVRRWLIVTAICATMGLIGCWVAIR